MAKVARWKRATLAMFRDASRLAKTITMPELSLLTSGGLTVHVHLCHRARHEMDIYIPHSVIMKLGLHSRATSHDISAAPKLYDDRATD